MPRPRDPHLRARLLDAAQSLIDQGDSVTIEAIVAATGASRGALYRRFPSRAALLEALRTERGRDIAVRPDRRGAILDAVGVLLTTGSLSSLTVEAVAAHAGASPATVYRQFGDRAGLLRAFGEERSPRRLAQTLQTHTTLRGGLTALATAGLEFFRDYPGLARLLFSSDPEMKALFSLQNQTPTSSRAQLVRFLQARRDAGDPLAGEPEELGAMFFGMVLAMGLLPSAGVPAPVLAERLVQLFLHGAILAPGGHHE